MYIKRLQIEEGFLDGIDLSFQPGLNVVIGPRGSGKTSVVELLRYCLGVQSFTEKMAKDSREHALSVLQSGQVTVTLSLDEHDVTVTRTYDEGQPRRTGDFPSLIILSQKEVEAVGLDEAGRLSIVDGFRKARYTIEGELDAMIPQVRSFTVEIRNIMQEIRDLDDHIRGLGDTSEALKKAEAEQKDIMKTVSKAEARQKELKKHTDMISAARLRSAMYQRVDRSISEWRASLERLLALPPAIEDWHASAGPKDRLSSIRSDLQNALASTSEGLRFLQSACDQLAQLEKDNESERISIEAKARTLRREFDDLQKGAGVVARRVSDLRDKANQLVALNALRKQKYDKLTRTQSKRGVLLDRLDELREQRFNERQTVGAGLSADLGPAIRVALERSGLHPEYVSAIRGALRGSGLHHAKLAPLLANELSPRELAEAVEGGNVDYLVEHADLARDRAQKIVFEMGTTGLEDILTVPIQDLVRFSLLDGSEYKTSENISTGQRCTVVLPILLRRSGLPLVIDQPEDHLDNAFIVDTLIEAIKKRANNDQLIMATHNPNIPVLGEASRVILLGSDGRHGFVREAAPLDDPASINAITNVMEGGREAFERRAQFYDSGRSAR